MNDAWAVVLAAVIGAVAAGVAGLQSQRRDKRERESLREELALVDELPDEGSKQQMRDHVRLRLWLYIRRENTRTTRLLDALRTASALGTGGFLLLFATNPDRFLSTEGFTWTSGALLAASYVIVMGTLFSIMRRLHRQRRREHATVHALLNARRRALTSSPPDAPRGNARRRFSLFRHEGR